VTSWFDALLANIETAVCLRGNFQRGAGKAALSKRSRRSGSDPTFLSSIVGFRRNLRIQRLSAFLRMAPVRAIVNGQFADRRPRLP